MADFAEIEKAMQKICNCASDALGRFSYLTDLPPTSMHESFMASYVFDHLGTKISMAPELMVSTIWEWNHYEIKPVPPLPLGIKPQQRVDLTLFTPQQVTKSEQRSWCFIEFKRNWNVEGDYWKLKSLTSLLRGHFAAACGIVQDTEINTRQWLGDEAGKLGEHFVVSQQRDYKNRPFVVAGYLFAAQTP